MASDLSVYPAFADDRGTLRITAPLPVVLTSFGVSRAAGTTAATMAWATASEQHSASFVVERATDPQAGFVVVDRVAAAGSSAATHQSTACAMPLRPRVLPSTTACASSIPTAASSFRRWRCWLPQPLA